MEKPELTIEEKTAIAAECAGIILGRIMRAGIILAGCAGLMFAGSMSAQAPARVSAPAIAKPVKFHIAHKPKKKIYIKKKVVDNANNLANVVAGIEERVTTLEERVNDNELS